MILHITVILIASALIGGFVGAFAGYLAMYRAFKIDLFNYEKMVESLNTKDAKEQTEICWVKGCDEPLYNLGYCFHHWNVHNQD